MHDPPVRSATRLGFAVGIVQVAPRGQVQEWGAQFGHRSLSVGVVQVAPRGQVQEWGASDIGALLLRKVLVSLRATIQPREVLGNAYAKPGI